MPFETLPPLEGNQKPSVDAQKISERKSDQPFEVVPGTGVRKQILVTSPTSIAFKGEPGGERKYEKVPATFYVLKETESMYKIGDEQGNEIGLLEKSPSVREWNVQGVYIPSDIPGRAKTLRLFNEPGGGQPAREVRVTRGSAFPILDHKTDNDDNEWYQIGPPLAAGEKFSGAMWVKDHNEEDQLIAQTGLLANEKSVRMFMVRLKSIAVGMGALSANERKGLEMDNLMNALRMSYLQFMGASPRQNEEQRETFTEYLERRGALSDFMIMTKNDIAVMDNQAYKQWLNRLGSSARHLEEHLANPKAEETITMHRNGRQEKLYVILFDRLP